MYQRSDCPTHDCMNIIKIIGCYKWREEGKPRIVSRQSELSRIAVIMHNVGTAGSGLQRLQAGEIELQMHINAEPRSILWFPFTGSGGMG